jgi:hypothetical protein
VHLALTILQGAGLAAACGVRPFLPALLAGALASANLGLDFAHTDYDFLEETGFLLAIVVALIATVALERRRGAVDFARGPGGAAVAGIGIGLGALLFAGSLADEHHAAWPGLLGGAACAGLASGATRGLFVRAAARLDEHARAALPVYADASALALAGLAVLAPPVTLAALLLFGWLLAGARRRADEKHAGLRVLK